MAKNRTIPFGYMMENGRITTNPKEVLAAAMIFSEYLSGKSLSKIAEQLRVPYSENSMWNKNMVKRILENEKYLGTDEYPQLISEDVFKRVRQKMTMKATSLCVIPKELQDIRKITFCHECGHRIFRSGGNSRPEKWDCHNKECEKFSYRLTDQMLTGAILCIINAVIANPTLIESDSEISSYKPNGEIIIKQNEINRLIDDPYSDTEQVKNEIFRLAEMKYDRCTYSDITPKTELIKSLVSDMEQLNSLDAEFMKLVIKRITVSHYSSVEAEFINGVKIRNITVRGEKNEHSSECNSNSCKVTAY